MYIKISKEENNYLIEYYYSWEEKEGFTQIRHKDLEDLQKNGKLMMIEENGQLVDNCFELKDIAQHIANNAILKTLMQNGEYHDEEKNYHLRLIHPSIRKIEVEELKFDPSVFDNLNDDDWQQSEDVPQFQEGTIRSCEVKGLEPKLSFQKAVIGCMVGNEYVEKATQIQPEDDWHYVVKSDIRLWNKKEVLLAQKINTALYEAGWNIVVSVQLEAKDDASFILDISHYTIPPYYIMYYDDTDFDIHGEIAEVTRDPDKLYLEAIRLLFKETKDPDERCEKIDEMLHEESFRECADYSMDVIHPRLLLKEGVIEVDDYLITDLNQISYITIPSIEDYEDEDEYEEAQEEFFSNINDLCHRVFFLKFV